jgi:hypothetical protein
MIHSGFELMQAQMLQQLLSAGVAVLIKQRYGGLKRFIAVRSDLFQLAQDSHLNCIVKLTSATSTTSSSAQSANGIEPALALSQAPFPNATDKPKPGSSPSLSEASAPASGSESAFSLKDSERDGSSHVSRSASLNSTNFTHSSSSGGLSRPASLGSTNSAVASSVPETSQNSTSHPSQQGSNAAPRLKPHVTEFVPSDATLVNADQWMPQVNSQPVKASLHTSSVRVQQGALLSQQAGVVCKANSSRHSL